MVTVCPSVRGTKQRYAIRGFRAEVDTLLAVSRENTLVYCSGPEALQAAVEKRCATWPPRSLHVERFSLDKLSSLNGHNPTLPVGPIAGTEPGKIRVQSNS
jgi:ferredoxin-NADP reductase